MKTVLIITALAALAGFSLYSQSSPALTGVATEVKTLSAESAFLDFIQSHGKHYKDHVEFRTRYTNFLKTHILIQEHNAKKLLSIMGHN